MFIFIFHPFIFYFSITNYELLSPTYLEIRVNSVLCWRWSTKNTNLFWTAIILKILPLTWAYLVWITLYVAAVSLVKPSQYHILVSNNNSSKFLWNSSPDFYHSSNWKLSTRQLSRVSNIFWEAALSQAQVQSVNYHWKVGLGILIFCSCHRGWPYQNLG